MYKKNLFGALSFLAVLGLYILYFIFFYGDVSKAISILIFIPMVLLILLAVIVFVYCLTDIIKHKLNILSVGLILGSIVFLIINIPTIQDIPYFITGNFIHYNGFVELGNEKDTSIQYDNIDRQYKVMSFRLSVLHLDNTEKITTRQAIDNITNLKLNRGAFEVVYLPHTKHLISFKKIDDSILSNNVKELDNYSTPVNIPKWHTTNTQYAGSTYSATVKTTILSYIPNKYMTEVGKLTGRDYIDNTFNGMAIKIRYDLSNMQTASEYKCIEALVPNEFLDFELKDAKGLGGGNILEAYNGSVLREIYYLKKENKDRFENGDSKSITGWILVFPDKEYSELPISLYIGKNLNNDKDFNQALRFDLPE